MRRVVLHHRLGHHESVSGLAATLGVPQDIVVHDYASFCPRVNLLNRPDAEAPLRYCGEPAEAGCIACCRIRDGGVQDRTPVPQLRARSAAEFAAADAIKNFIGASRNNSRLATGRLLGQFLVATR